jgi:hypothetical protein
MNIIKKDKNMIVYNAENDHIPRNFMAPTESPRQSEARHKSKLSRKSLQELQKNKEFFR